MEKSNLWRFIIE